MSDAPNLEESKERFPEKAVSFTDFPHLATIKFQIVINPITQDGSIHPTPASKEKLNKCGIDEYALLQVQGADLYTCIQNVKEKLEKLNG
jgi:hypothetical protein